MIDLNAGIGRLATTNPDVLRFFQQASGIPGYSDALVMLVEARERALQCLKVRPHAAGSYHLARFNGHVVTRELAAIAGVTHLTTYTTEQLDQMQLFEGEQE